MRPTIGLDGLGAGCSVPLHSTSSPGLAHSVAPRFALRAPHYAVLWRRDAVWRRDASRLYWKRPNGTCVMTLTTAIPSVRASLGDSP